MTEITALPQKIAKRKTIVLKSRLDPTMARLLGEKVKAKVFARLRFLKPKPEEIRLVSVEKYYEPYVVVGGKYAVDYCRQQVYPISVDENAREVAFFDKKFKPEPLNQLSQGPHKVIKLDGVAYFHYEDKGSLILDKIGREIDPEQLPCAPSEERTVEELAKSGMKFTEVKVALDEEIDSLRSRIAHRPSGVGEVIREVFEVNERALIYCPVYQLELINVKTGKKALVEIDGNTGRTISTEFTENRSMKKFIEAQINDMPHISENSVEGEPDLRESPSASDSASSHEEPESVLNTVSGTSQISGSEAEENLDFPANVPGEVDRAEGTVTAAGDLEIPAGTIVYETLVIQGRLRIGTDCQILGEIRAAKDIVIGANTKIEGNLSSGGDVIVGPDSILHGSVESSGHVEVGENAVIEGNIHSKYSVVLNPFAKVYARR